MLSEQINSFDVGDVIIKEEMVNEWLSLYNTESDTIISKQIFNGFVSYQVQYHRRDVSYNSSSQALTVSNYSAGRTDVYPTGPLFDTTRMPEEYKNPYVAYYLPSTDVLCYTSTQYTFDEVPMRGASINLDWRQNHYSYKNGMGLIKKTSKDIVSNLATDTFLMGISKKGVFCGSSEVLGVSNVMQRIRVNIYPNPAADVVTIALSDATAVQHLQIMLSDIAGNPMGHWQMKNNTMTLNTVNIPNGLYLLKITDGDGSLMRKLNILR